MRKTRHNIAGFTLIEILASVVVIGLCAAIILPQMQTRNDLKTVSAAREITADLLYAQNRAIATGQTHYVVFDAAHGKYDVMDSISPQHIITHPVLGTSYEVIFNTGALVGVTGGTVSFDGQSTVAFDSLGTPYTYTASTQTTSPLIAGSIVLSAGNATTTISVMPFSGEIKIQ